MLKAFAVLGDYRSKFGGCDEILAKSGCAWNARAVTTLFFSQRGKMHYPDLLITPDAPLHTFGYH